VDVNRSSFYLLDTNIAGYIVSGRSTSARSRLRENLAQARVAISAITEAEIRYGLELKSGSGRLRSAVEQLFTLIEVQAWDSPAAVAYGRLRTRLQAAGTPLSAMDLMIASHALSLGATLVSHDGAFQHVKGFVTVVDWATDL
jgi:tRNA(fMet)-specific endonuclease VapC